MNIPYRTRRALRRLFLSGAVLVLFAALLLFCWMLWLNRYVVYTRDGAKIDFSLSVQYGPGQTPVEPVPAETLEIHDKTPEETEPVSTELARFSGYIVSIEELTEDFDATVEKLKALPKGSTVALELKDTKGYTYYTSAVATTNPNFDTAKVDELVQTLIAHGYYVIARIPAFQEYHYIMENERERVSYGLPQQGGSALWLDKEFRCYWLNPASDGTVAYLIQLITELRTIGFDEVAFLDFRFPNTDKVTFTGNKTDALTATAATLVKTCATDTFCVSFTRTEADLTLPAGRTRLYVTGISAADAAETAAQTAFADPSIQLVFITDLSDTRYDEFCVLRPLESAH